MFMEAPKPQPVHSPAELALVRVIPPGVCGQTADRHRRAPTLKPGSDVPAQRARRAREVGVFTEKLLAFVRQAGRPVTYAEVKLAMGREVGEPLAHLTEQEVLQTRRVREARTSRTHLEWLPADAVWPAVAAGLVLVQTEAVPGRLSKRAASCGA
ncbi:hypothetical protein [uncultured Thiodictyon sp.]|uniref:hypothetical protein n=1 Tax=uncultured Thiodictyon sp. TaxID=1846217 RepID=UPI0025DBB972|nr:hypothetical protein [uncultured Thiodictyon sp.]